MVIAVTTGTFQVADLLASAELLASVLAFFHEIAYTLLMMFNKIRRYEEEKEYRKMMINMFPFEKTMVQCV